jgi:hypothetical protein
MSLTFDHIKSIQGIKQMANACAIDNVLLADVVEALSHKDYYSAYNASWILAHCFTEHPDLYQTKYTSLLLHAANAFKAKSGIKRNVLKVFQSVELMGKQIETVLELAYNTLEDLKAEAALRAFSITILERYVQHFPELIPDLVFKLERELPNASAAFTVRAKLFLKRYRTTS